MTHMSHDPESADAQKREHRASSRREENAMWSIFGYLLSGLLFWGGVGWAADRFFNHLPDPDRPLGWNGRSPLPRLVALRARVTSPNEGLAGESNDGRWARHAEGRKVVKIEAVLAHQE